MTPSQGPRGGLASPRCEPEDIQTHDIVNEHPADRLHAAAGPLTMVAGPIDPRQKKVGASRDVPASEAKSWKKPWDR
jgi:hypothetical protein